MNNIHPISGKCFICGKNIEGSTKKVLTKHIKQAHEIELTNEDLYLKWYRLKQPKCPFCENHRKFYSFTLGYAGTCGKSICSRKLHSQTDMERYGVHSTNARQETIAKKQKTYYGKTGYKSPFSKNSPGRIKIKQTILSRFGVEHPSKSEEIKIKTIRTNQSKYGVDYPAQNQEVYEKIIKTNIERYGVKTTLLIPEVQEKIVKTIVDKYGVDSPLKSPAIKIKSKLTCLSKYGFDHPSKSPEVREKMQKTSLKHFGVSCSFNVPEIREKSKKAFYQYINDRRGKLVTTNNFHSKKVYYRIVNNLTKYSISKYYKLIWNMSYGKAHVEKESLFDDDTPLWKRVQVDHKYSKLRGWADNIPPMIIGSVFNLTYLTSFDNDSKDVNCSITLRGLKLLRTKIKKKYPDLFKDTDDWGYPIQKS
jgi:hypothetical protein